MIDPTVNVGNKSVLSGIPEEAFNLECPDLELKASVLQQFILLDGKYVERLNLLEEDHCSVLRLTMCFCHAGCTFQSYITVKMQQNMCIKCYTF